MKINKKSVVLSCILGVLVMAISFMINAKANEQDKTLDVNVKQVFNRDSDVGSETRKITESNNINKTANLSKSSNITTVKDDSVPATSSESTVGESRSTTTVEQSTVSKSTSTQLASPVPTVVPSTSLNNFVMNRQVFIGDSRTVGMNRAVGNCGHFWSAKEGSTYDWLKTTGVPEIQGKIKTGTAAIFLMGVNDLWHTDLYIKYINSKARAWGERGAKTYFVSVNPVNEATFKNFKNSKIEAFNAKMKANLVNVEYIDTYNQIKKYDIQYTPDGLHYLPETNKKIYEIIQAELNK